MRGLSLAARLTIDAPTLGDAIADEFAVRAPEGPGTNGLNRARKPRQGCVAASIIAMVPTPATPPATAAPAAEAGRAAAAALEPHQPCVRPTPTTVPAATPVVVAAGWTYPLGVTTTCRRCCADAGAASATADMADMADTMMKVLRMRCSLLFEMPPHSPHAHRAENAPIEHFATASVPELRCPIRDHSAAVRGRGCDAALRASTPVPIGRMVMPTETPVQSGRASNPT